MNRILYNEIKDGGVFSLLEKHRDAPQKYESLNFRRRAIQTLLGGRIFTFPGLAGIKNNLYTRMFHCGRNFQVFCGVNFSRTHGINGTTLIGDDVHINANTHIDYTGDVIIGNNVDIAENCVILSHKHSSLKIIGGSGSNEAVPAKTVICDGARIQVGCIIYPGVTIGEYANVYSGSVVMENVEPYAIVMGNPARDARDMMRELKRDRRKSRSESQK